MKTLLLFLSTFVLFSAHTNISEDEVMDECHFAFDLSDKGPHIISKEKAMSLKDIPISYNYCSEENEPLITAYYFKFIYAPIEKPASLITSSDGNFSDDMISQIASGQSGDKILIEGIKYEKDKIVHLLPPVVFVIE